ncbi:TPA: hypothetical protein RP356_000995 [Acinetobacter baumannii]|nr:hypothetical protein [Acinetobacter baumannii]
MKKNAVITITAVFLDHIGKITNPYMETEYPEEGAMKLDIESGAEG